MYFIIKRMYSIKLILLGIDVDLLSFVKKIEYESM